MTPVHQLESQPFVILPVSKFPFVRASVPFESCTEKLSRSHPSWLVAKIRKTKVELVDDALKFKDIVDQLVDALPASNEPFIVPFDAVLQLAAIEWISKDYN